MAHGKNLADWNRTSHLIALLININREKGKPAVKPQEFNPYTPKQKKGKADFYITPSQLAKKLKKEKEERRA